MERKIIGILGSIMVVVSTFCPLLKIDSAERINFYSESSMRISGIILVALGLAAVYIFNSENIWLSRTAATVVSFFALRCFIVILIKNLLPEAAEFQNEPLVLLKELSVAILGISWGGIVLIIGVILILFTSFTMRKKLEINLWSF